MGLLTKLIIFDRLGLIKFPKAKKEVTRQVQDYIQKRLKELKEEAS